jgi:hypothetical protein
MSRLNRARLALLDELGEAGSQERPSDFDINAFRDGPRAARGR